MTDAEMSVEIGRNVRAERERAGMTQATLSRATGIRVPHLSRLESGAGGLPKVGTVKKIADVLGVRVCWLIDGRPRRRG